MRGKHFPCPLCATDFFFVLQLFLCFQSKPNCQCGVGAGGVHVPLHPSPRTCGLRHSDLCAHRNWYHLESSTAGTGTEPPHLHACVHRILVQTIQSTSHVSVSGLHGRKHHVESGWPVDHAAERPLWSTGTRQGDTCQQQEGGETLLFIFQCLTHSFNYTEAKIL